MYYKYNACDVFIIRSIPDIDRIPYNIVVDMINYIFKPYDDLELYTSIEDNIWLCGEYESILHDELFDVLKTTDGRIITNLLVHGYCITDVEYKLNLVHITVRNLV